MTENGLTRKSGSGEDDASSLIGALTILRRRWPLMLGIIIVCVAVAGLRFHSTAKKYNATASVTYDNNSLSDAALQVSQGTVDPTRDGATNVLIATSLQVADAVKANLRSPAPAAEILRAISVQAAPNANVLQITASTGSPAYSAALANAFATQYVAFETQSQINGINAAQLQLQQQLNALPPSAGSRNALQQSIQRLAQLRAVANGGVQIISRANRPTAPSGITMSTSLVLGGLIGLGLGLLLTFLLESLDRRIESVEAIEQEYGLPTLAVIPQKAFRGSRAASREKHLEAYRVLRTTLDLSAVTRKLDVLLITSCASGEGKTTVAVDLARAMALAGRPVTLIELDLRRPTFGKQFGIDPRQGFTTVVAGHDSLERVLVRPFPELPHFAVLASGPLPSDPAELLESRAATLVLEEAKRLGGTVVIDTPPLNPVADTHVLLANPVVAAALVVARVRFTTRQDVRRARAILDRNMLEPLGVIVTGMGESGLYGYQSYRSFPQATDLELDLDRDLAASRAEEEEQDGAELTVTQAAPGVRPVATPVGTPALRSADRPDPRESAVSGPRTNRPGSASRGQTNHSGEPRRIGEDASRRAVEREEARRRAAEEEQARWRAVEEEQARRRAVAEEEEQARRRAVAEEEEQARRRAVAEEEEQAHRRAVAEEEEQAHRRAVAEEEEQAHRRAVAEEEQQARRRQAESAPAPRRRPQGGETPKRRAQGREAAKRRSQAAAREPRPQDATLPAVNDDDAVPAVERGDEAGNRRSRGKQGRKA